MVQAWLGRRFSRESDLGRRYPGSKMKVTTSRAKFVGIFIFHAVGIFIFHLAVGRC